MKVSTILSLFGLVSTSIAAPSHSGKQDVNIFLHESTSDHVETSMGPILNRGIYTISSPVLEQRGLVIGRGLAEDKSLNPKRIKTVPWDHSGQTQWRVEPVGDRRYRLSVGTRNWRPAPVANIEGKLFAILLPEPQPGEWIIEYQEIYDAYTIVSADENSRGLGWVVDPDPDQQVSVRPLFGTPSIPPRFPPTHLFTCRPILNDAMASTKKAGLNIEVTIEDL